jgi:hypothetical protein
MSYANQVSIGPKFFKKVFNDYANKFWAFVREIMQNSMDCGSTEIAISVEKFDETSTGITVTNDGEPMTREILLDKLLSLGESGKDFKGAVGGFGKAKEILYFAQKSYSIRSGRWLVSGSGVGYNLTEQTPELWGTRSSIIWDGQVVNELCGAFRRFIELCGTGRRVAFLLNGEPVRPKHHPGEIVRTLDRDEKPWAEVRTSGAERGLLFVRVGGVPMFTKSIDFKATVAIDLLGSSGDLLTANRDGLKWQFDEQLSQFITAIAVDKRTAFKRETPVYKRFEGPKLNATINEKLAGKMMEKLVAALTEIPVETPEPMGGAGILIEVKARTEAPKPALLGHEFILKSCVNRPIRPEFDPDNLKFSDHAHWLIRAWAGSLLELHALHFIDKPFSIGFIFDETAIAQFEETSAYGRVFYLNPCRIARRMNKRRFTKGKRFTIVAFAAHEFVHGALGESYHGEDFAAKLTEVMATILKHSRRFTRHLR